MTNPSFDIPYRLKVVFYYVILIVILFFGISYIYPLFFNVNIRAETYRGDPVNGSVYLDRNFEGELDSGVIEVSQSDLDDAENLLLQGEFNGLDYEVEFDTESLNKTEDRILLKLDESKGKQRLDFVGLEEDFSGLLYNNGHKISKVENGYTKVNPKNIEAGEIALEGETTNFTFEYYESDKELTNIEFVIDEGFYRQDSYDPLEELDFDKVEEETIKYINKVRRGVEVEEPSIEIQKYDLDDYEDWEDFEYEIPEFEIIEVNESEEVEEECNDVQSNKYLNNVASYKSNDFIENEYYSHESPEGKNHLDLLKNEEIPFGVTHEILNRVAVEGIPYHWNEDDLARFFVSSWLDSPDHRSTVVDRDNMFTDIGVGVECSSDFCYATGIKASMEIDRQQELEEGYCSMEYLHDPGWGLDYTFDADLNLNMDKGSIEIHLVEETYEEFENCVDGLRIDSYSSYEVYNQLDKSLNDIKPGEGFVIYTEEDSALSYNIKMEPSGD